MALRVAASTSAALIALVPRVKSTSIRSGEALCSSAGQHLVEMRVGAVRVVLVALWQGVDLDVHTREFLPKPVCERRCHR